jgi:hypothetical protein
VLDTDKFTLIPHTLSCPSSSYFLDVEGCRASIGSSGFHDFIAGLNASRSKILCFSWLYVLTQ